MDLTEPEAVAGIALLAMYSDGVLAPEEDESVRAHLSTYPLFEEMDDDDLGAMLERLSELSAQDDGEALLEACCGALGDFLRPTAFYIAADVIASDGVVEITESDFLARLQKMLALPEANAKTIIEVVGIARRLPT